MVFAVVISAGLPVDHQRTTIKDEQRIGENMRKMGLLLFLCLLLSGNVWAAEGGGVVSSVVSKGTASWDGKALPDYDKGTPEITILRITIPSGALLPVHKHPVINAGVMVAGELTVVTDEGKTLRLKAGDGIVEVVNTLHYGKNEGDTPAVIIVFYAGTTGKPLTVNQ
jgi:quercetin dioxygenase-like cupin family protein